MRITPGTRESSQTRLLRPQGAMGKTIAYVAAAVVFLGIGALTTGLIIWYHHPNLQSQRLVADESVFASCELQSTGEGGNVTGILNLRQVQSSAPVSITGNITGLTLGLHGFHVHQYGVSGAQCVAAGGHYNPFGFDHSAPNATERHVGDLGNIEAVRDGATGNTIAQVNMNDIVLKMSGQYSIIGRAFVVHAGEDNLGRGDDEGSRTTGNAGRRVACCTIYVTKSPE